MKQFNPTVGNDPELFIKNGLHLLPAELLIGESETIPKFIKIDNAAIEIHPGPNLCLQTQNAALSAQLSAVRKLLKDKYKISLRAAEKLRPTDLKKYKSLTSFGCEPSLVFHPETGLTTSVPKADPLKTRERSIGYHVHLGTVKPETVKKQIAAYKKDLETRYTALKMVVPQTLVDNYQKDQLYFSNLLHTTEGRARLVRSCDLFVGLPAVLIDRDNRQTWRRKLLGYGKAGEFREQPHGFEYRTLGPWPLHHPALTWWANAAVRDALTMVINDMDLEVAKAIDMVEVAEAINNNSLARAIPLWNQIKKIIGHTFTLDSGSHPWSAENIKMFEFLVANGGISLLLKNSDVILAAHKPANAANTTPLEKKENIWEAKSVNAGDREWLSYFFGFPTSMRELTTRSISIKDLYKDFSSNWSMEKDVLTKAML